MEKNRSFPYEKKGILIIVPTHSPNVGGIETHLGDIFCIPSQYEEGYGRVAAEALACGSPVVGSNKGGIPEVVSCGVGILVDPSVKNLTEAILRLHEDHELFNRLQQSCRSYAEKNFSSRNADIIFKGYEGIESLKS